MRTERETRKGNRNAWGCALLDSLTWRHDSRGGVGAGADGFPIRLDGEKNSEQEQENDCDDQRCRPNTGHDRGFQVGCGTW